MQEAFNFLNLLEKNNTREWFSENKPQFQIEEAKIKLFFNDIFNELQKSDQLESCKVFRIYRDVRFSKEKIPYKTNFSCGMVRAKPHLRGGYYLHLQPQNSFIGGGFWEPNKEDLLRIRKEFELDSHSILQITSSKEFTKTFGKIHGEELKTAPKGFDKNHEAIDLIRKKQYLITKKYSDEDVFSSNFKQIVNEDFKQMRPFFDYMSDILGTDLNGERLI